MPAEIKIEKVPEYDKDIKKISKKYKHIEEDIYRALTAIKTNPSNFHGSVLINGLGETIKNPIFKLKKFRSTDIHGKGSRSGFRLIYSYESNLNKIILIQFYYHKNESTDCDKKRIKKYFQHFK
jgi:mRNA-degrading endonuclease RelE of RelBE toxin-antitoxin system